MGRGKFTRIFPMACAEMLAAGSTLGMTTLFTRTGGAAVGSASAAA